MTKFGLMAAILAAGGMAAATPALAQNMQNPNTPYQPWWAQQHASLSQGVVQQVQRQLQQDGFYQNGDIDGLYGPNTAQAIANFQRQNGLAVTGQLNGQTLQALGVSLNQNSFASNNPNYNTQRDYNNQNAYNNGNWNRGQNPDYYPSTAANPDYYNMNGNGNNYSRYDYGNAGARYGLGSNYLVHREYYGNRYYSPRDFNYGNYNMPNENSYGYNNGNGYNNGYGYNNGNNGAYPYGAYNNG